MNRCHVIMTYLLLIIVMAFQNFQAVLKDYQNMFNLAYQVSHADQDNFAIKLACLEMVLYRKWFSFTYHLTKSCTTFHQCCHQDSSPHQGKANIKLNLPNFSDIKWLISNFITIKTNEWQNHMYMRTSVVLLHCYVCLMNK